MWLIRVEEEKEFFVKFSHVNISNNFSCVIISNSIKKRTLKQAISKRFLWLWGRAGGIKEVKTQTQTKTKKTKKKNK